MAPREQWGTRAGFIMAAVGSAVGLGNMWRFPYYTAENGGAVFVFLYLAMTALIGLPIMLAEMTLGRGARQSPIKALEHYGGKRWMPLGFLFVAAGFLILSYYSVIAGWTVRYFIQAVRGFEGAPADLFGSISQGTPAIAFHLGFLAVTIWVVSNGVKGGIERASTLLMPVLFLVVVGIAVYAWTLPGSGEGYSYYIGWNPSEFVKTGADGGFWAQANVISEAAGQAFFSLSLGMGAMLTFSSYLKKDSHLPNESLVIASADFGVAFIAGLMVFPLIFALGLSSAIGESTVGALFITLPRVFQEMGGVTGHVVGTLFFGALTVGALTSAISLLEVVTSSIIDTFGWARKRAAWVMGATAAALGILPAMSTDALGYMDKIAEGLFLVLGALGLGIFVGYVMKDPVGEVSKGTKGIRWFGVWRTLLRFVVPPIVGFVLIVRLRDIALATLAWFE